MDHLTTTYQPPADHLWTTCWPPTDHLLTTWWLPMDHLPTTYRPPTDHLLTTYRPPADHLWTTYGPPADHLRTTCWPPMDHLRTTCWPHMDHLPPADHFFTVQLQYFRGSPCKSQIVLGHPESISDLNNEVTEIVGKQTFLGDLWLSNEWKTVIRKDIGITLLSVCMN